MLTKILADNLKKGATWGPYTCIVGDNIKMDLKVVKWEVVDCICLTQSRRQ
jgi:hypothetical protein